MTLNRTTQSIGATRMPAGDDTGSGAPRSLFARARGMLSRLVHDRRGGIAMIFGLSLVPITLGAGLAVDLGRAYAVKSRLSYALDAAGLAVGSSSGTTAELQQIMQRYFDANYPASEYGVPATPTMTITNDQISLSVTADVSTLLMGAVGVDNIQVAASSLIVKETKGLEIVMVLDNTGSMSGSKIQSLKTAATDLVNIVFGNETAPALLKMGIVPFTGSVNIGASNTSLLTGYNPSDFSPDVWRGCVEARNYPNDTLDTSIGVGGAWRPYLWQPSWINPWPPISGSRGEIQGPNMHCPVSLLPLTNQKQDITNKINEMEARGVTHINFGAVWGWRVLSEDPPFTQGLPYNDPDNQKVAIIMTDGENFISNYTGTYSAYGSLYDGRLGTTSKSAAEAELNRRLGEVCTNMKNNDILIYTITFQVSSSTARDVMRSCATDPSKYFDSPSNAELEANFRAIAQQLSNLRIGH